ncbi:MAG: FixH family protein, partial [Candidatus Promineofilum sp.]|nr:FixH family protein [Promineifilum sp.]
PPLALWERVGERVFLLLLLLLLLPACRQAAPVDQAPEVRVLLTPGPDSLFVGPISFDLTLWNADGQPIDGANPVSLRGDMSHAGMEPVLATAAGAGDGLYTADFEWTMAGDWTVTIEATLPDGRLKIVTFPFTVEEFEADE